jgi:hypothetical protein
MPQEILKNVEILDLKKQHCFELPVPYLRELAMGGYVVLTGT